MNRAGRIPEASLVGIDVGGTKIAAGLVDAESGRVLAREELPTLPERGGAAVLSDCAALVHALGAGDVPVGIGLCELVDPTVLVIGGGLGGEPLFRERVAEVVRSSIAFPPVPALEILGSEVGPDGGLVSLPTGNDALLDESEAICREGGATLARAPFVEGADRRLAAITSFPAAVALAERIGVERGLDVDRSAWTDDYYRVPRASA